MHARGAHVVIVIGSTGQVHPFCRCMVFTFIGENYAILLSLHLSAG